jgi:hypothetical protein
MQTWSDNRRRPWFRKLHRVHRRHFLKRTAAVRRAERLVLNFIETNLDHDWNLNKILEPRFSKLKPRK